MDTKNVDESDFVDTTFFTGENPADSDQEAAPGLSDSFSQKQIGSIAKYEEPVNGNNPIDMLIEMFQKQSDLMAVPVEEYDHVIGVIDRKTVFAVTNTAWKRFTAKSISDYTQRVSSLLYAHDFIEKALQKVSESNRNYGISYFPVFNNKSFFGLVSLDSFLSRIAEIREQDLQKASIIQTSMMPDKQKLSSLPYHITAWNRMANALGGDFYEVFPVGRAGSMICCFDVSGKNVAASLLTIATGSFFKTLKFIPELPSSPLKIISLLDEYLEDVVPSGNFITAVICYVDLENKTFSLFNCGHTTTYILYKDPGTAGNGKIASIKPGLPPLGMGVVKAALSKDTEGKSRPYSVVQLKPGIHIDLYTDGFTDMKNDDGLRYEDVNVKDFFVNLYNVRNEEIESTITRTIDTYIQHSMLPDDITVLDIRF
jgi:phosphoserine phosphatase RsbU/P